MKLLREQNGKFTLTDGRTQLLLLPQDAANADGFHCLGFRLVDEAKMLASAERLGATVERAPDWENGAREQFLLRDPDGNQLALFQDRE
jgi:catechol-2,3-dioxygenase